jgi:hypothetical protein
MQISVDDMRGAGKAGYVAKIGDRFEKHFLTAAEYSGHGASRKTVTYEISEDGVYEVCDANYGARKRKISFLVVKNGQCVFESEKLDDAYRHFDVLTGRLEAWATDGDVLPELEGSPKQIAWAVDIRSKAIAGGLPTAKAATVTSAKAWIDNRSKLAKYGVR